MQDSLKANYFIIHVLKTDSKSSPLSSLFLTGDPGMPGSPFLPGIVPPDTTEPGSP